jgi:hypothetical protein
MMKKDNRTLMVLARELKKDIGIHYKSIGKYVPTEKYQELQRKSDDAVNLAKYLIHQLENRAAALHFAYAVGMPGYFHQAKGL